VQELAFTVDTLDTVAFPTRGTLFSLSWQRLMHSKDEGPVLARQSVQGLQAFHLAAGPATCMPSGRAVWAMSMPTRWAASCACRDDAGFGGGQPHGAGADGDGAQHGRHAGRAGRRCALGLLAGSGRRLQPRKSAALGRAASGSQRFVAVDTRFGPLYFGAGTTKGGNSSGYLFLGPIW
jgi:NTE family protein